MSLNRYAVQRDANEPQIIAALQACGCDVMRSDVVDLIVGRAGMTFMLECKIDHKQPLTPAQVDLKLRWRGHWCVVTTIDEALAAVGL